MASTALAHARRLALDDLPREVLDRILVFLPLRDLASLNATARLFHGAPPGGCSPVERALRERARARGHERALPTSLPSGVRTWTAELLVRERVLELACAHSPPVAAGHHFSACVDAEGGLHTCGEEAVTHEFRMPEYPPRMATGHSGALAVLVPTHVASLSAVRVVAVAAGKDHLLALSAAGAVYGCGNNQYGQLGLGHTEEQRSFTLVGLPASEPIVCIAAACEVHSLALTAAGCAYSWGHNSCGQLGHGDTEDRLEPTRIEALDGVRVGGVSAGYTHTLLLSTDGDVYSCGQGYYGQLGHGGQQYQLTRPRRIEALVGVRAVHVSAGGRHSLVVDSEGAVYSFGYGEYGALGHGDRRHQLAPRRLDALAGVRIVRACAGSSSCCSAVLGADGSVHTFGSSRNGVLGLGYGEFGLRVPSRVDALAQARVVHCAMRYYRSLFVTADGSVHSCGRQSAALGLGMSAGELDEPLQWFDTPTCVETAWRARVCC